MTTTKKDNLKNSLCYIPLVAIVLYFTEENKTEEFKDHMNHWIFLFIVYTIVHVVFGFLFFFWYFAMSWLITLLYLIISVVLWYKAYIWEDINIKGFDDIEIKINKKSSIVEKNNLTQNTKDLNDDDILNMDNINVELVEDLKWDLKKNIKNNLK